MKESGIVGEKVFIVVWERKMITKPKIIMVKIRDKSKCCTVMNTYCTFRVRKDREDREEFWNF